MANTLAHGLVTPRTDTYYDNSGGEESYTVIPATSTATAAPDGDTPFVNTGNIDTVRAFCRYTGTVTGELVLWLLQDGVWYRAASDVLNSANGNEVFDGVLLGRHTRFTYQVESIAGGGSVEVRVMGVW